MARLTTGFIRLGERGTVPEIIEPLLKSNPTAGLGEKPRLGVALPSAASA